MAGRMPSKKSNSPAINIRIAMTRTPQRFFMEVLLWHRLFPVTRILPQVPVLRTAEDVLYFG